MPRTGPTRTRSEGGHPVCPRSDCPSCAEQMTDTTRWSCERRPDASLDVRFGGTFDAVVGRNDANAAPRINQRWRESRNGRMAKEKLTWVHLTTQHVSSINVRHVMLRSMRRTARVQGSSLQILLMILRSSSRNGELFHILSGNETADMRIMVELQNSLFDKRQSFDMMQTTKKETAFAKWSPRYLNARRAMT